MSDQLPGEWAERAACIGMDESIFFPEHFSDARVAEAKAICGLCPVRRECLEYGLHERFGIWGGMTERQRRNERRRRAGWSTSNRR